MKQKIINTFKGIAIGDAFGLGIEFKSRPWILRNIDFTSFVNVWKGGENNILPGYYSDDTEHSIGVIRALLDDRDFSEALLLEMFKDEYESDIKRKGHPRDGHGSIEHWYTGQKTIAEVRNAQASREDPGNAPVMRAVPLCFVGRNDLWKYSVINSDSTHPHKFGRIGSFITSLAGWHLLRTEGEHEDVIPFVQKECNDGEISEMLSVIDALPAPAELSEENFIALHGVQPLPYISWDPNIYGLPCASLKTALNVCYVLKHSRSALQGLKNSINMGGDIDSLAAVCTGILAGVYGLDSLPEFLLEKTEGLERMESLGRKVYEKYF